MKKNKLVIKINKPSKDVYGFYINPQNTPMWLDFIFKENVSEWPIKIGSIYKNQNIYGNWMQYTVVTLVENKIFELVSQDGNYHVRYTHKDIDKNSSFLKYYEWVDHEELEDPFTIETLRKLKEIIENN